MTPPLRGTVLRWKRPYSAAIAFSLACALALLSASDVSPAAGREATPDVALANAPVSPPAGSPTKAAAAPLRVRVAAAGDVACEPPYRVTRHSCRHGKTARLIRSRSVAAVLPLGDTQYDSGALADYRASYDVTWGAFKRRTYPVVGNHEYGTPNAAGFLSYFGARVPNPRVWYASNIASWRIYVLNSNCNEVNCAAELTWLKRDLNAHPRRCSLAAMHHPRFSSGEHGNSLWAARFWPTLDSHQVDLVLAGHDHDYERFARRHSSGAVAANGLQSFVVGTAGKSLYSFRANKQRGSRFRYNRSAGVLFLVLRDSGYTWRYRRADGTVLDSGNAKCLT